MTEQETNLVPVTIDDEEVMLPEGMNLVDACKIVGVDIPVFCYHPKLGHDGNCRMCLVELALPRPSRETGEMELAWFPTLQISCAQRVSSGMAIRTTTDKVVDGRREILEFLLSSHPLDCPICDKGGECPLQNLTMNHGPGTSRMYWNDKMHLGKHVPLGDLIYLDQERCIHCSRCIRFQEGVADDPVLNFDYRGRKQRIITYSEPGFDSIWSGNTTDICPVGALTTADFRFNARPWEMVQVASIDSHTPEGSNISFDTRTDREAGGRTTIRRVMPRQNEAVNEIWIHDKTRLLHHYMEHEDRLTTPLVRKGGQLTATTWEEAIDTITARLKDAGEKVAAIAGPRLSNEDFYTLQKFIRARGSNNLNAYPARSIGAEFVAQVGVGVGTNLLELGKGDAILVVASDLHQEAPIWWLRVKEAAKRGATLIVLNGRETRLDEFATYTIRYQYGEEVNALNDLGESDFTTIIAEANNAIVFAGSEGLDANTSYMVAQSAASLLVSTGHVGKANNGLIIVWPGANMQGAYDMGFNQSFGPGYVRVEKPGLGFGATFEALSKNDFDVLFISGADVAFDDAEAEEALRATQAMIVVSDMFLTRTAEIADVVLPVQSIAEREGTYTSGERRVQRFYQAIEPIGESKADWEIASMLEHALTGADIPIAASLIFRDAVAEIPQYAGITYASMAEVTDQFPDVGGEDLYFGGTSFQNHSGLGVQWASASESGDVDIQASNPSKAIASKKGELVLVPVASLYNREELFTRTTLLDERTPPAHIIVHPKSADKLGIEAGDMIGFSLGGTSVWVEAWISNRAPEGTGIVPRHLQVHGAPVSATSAEIMKMEKASA